MSNSIRDPVYRELIAGIVVERTKAQLSQQAVADKLGLPQSYIAKVEGYERRIDVLELLQLAKAVGFDPIALVRRAWRRISESS